MLLPPTAEVATQVFYVAICVACVATSAVGGRGISPKTT